MTSIVRTERFSEVAVKSQNIVLFPQGLIGYESYRDFVLIRSKQAPIFYWLQSLIRPDLCFLLVNPKRVWNRFNPRVSKEDRGVLQFKNGRSLPTYLSIVRVDRRHRNIFANLKSPIAINSSRRVAKQVVVENEGYSVKFPIRKNAARKNRIRKESRLASLIL